MCMSVCRQWQDLYITTSKRQKRVGSLPMMGRSAKKKRDSSSSCWQETRNVHKYMILLEAAGSKPEIFTNTCLACFSCSVTAWQKLRPMEKKVSSLGASYAVTSSAGCKDWKWMPCPTQQSWEAPDPSHPSPTPILPSAAHAAKDSRPTLAFLNMSSTDTLMWSICTLMWSICDAWN